MTPTISSPYITQKGSYEDFDATEEMRTFALLTRSDYHQSIHVCRDTGINRGTVTRLYHETCQRVELDAVDKLCEYLHCEVSDLFERTKH